MKKICLLALLFGAFSLASIAQTYCSAGGGMDEYIVNVSFGSISNPSGSTNYSDFSYLSTNMVIGESYPAVITNGNPYIDDQCGIWVDWNQDFDFDDPGEFYLTLGTPGVGPYSASIIPPDSALLGPTIMRIRIMYTGSLSSCGGSQYGEVEDYTVNVLPNCQANAEFSYFDLGFTVDFVAPMNYDTALFNLNWDLGDGTTVNYQSEFAHSYSLPGIYIVSLSVNELADSTCFDSFIDTLYIDSCEANAEFEFNVDELNVELWSYFQYDTLLYYVTWDMGDSTIIQGGDTVSHTYALPGIYPVSLTVINLSDTTCQNTVGYDLEAYECDVMADFDVDILGYEAFFSTPASAGNYIIEWDFGDGSYTYNLSNPSHMYGAMGTYTVSLTLTDLLQPLCFDQISYDVLINDCYANASFIFDNFGLQTAFNATTYNSAGYSFIWDFGDGTIDTSSTIVFHTYADEGTYTISLTMTSDSIPFCSDTDSLTISIDSCLAYPEFGYNGIGLSVDFYAYYPLDTVNYSLIWDFGDGATTSNILEPNHLYAAPGMYQASFTVSNLYDTSCSDTYTMLFEVYECTIDPEFVIIDNGGSNYDFVLLNDYIALGYDVSWSLSDGTNFWGVDSLNYTISSDPVFEVTVMVSNWNVPNCQESYSLAICNMDAGFDYFTNGLDVSFNTLVQYSSMGYYIEWDFGDGTTQVGGFSPTHSYPGDDTYTITCAISSLSFPDCSDTVSVDLYVAECYVFADFNYQIDSTTVVFTTTYSIGQYNFYWDFGDGTTQIAVPNIVHTYALTGDYEVCLILVDPANSDCSDTICYTLSVYPSNLPENNQLGEGIKLFPNPVEEMLHLEFYDEKSTLYPIFIYNSTGQKVISEVLQSKAGHNIFSIDVGRLPSGIYFVGMNESGRFFENLKFIK
ncbi:MAG: PKD domain-containing protein [Bacteroidales bacterium]|nr:PKD domain-containing protein [Bacteroidales bacterium]MCF8455310.1 PKD domain-containing protein [Bacteroidales bacterium]